MTRNDFEGYNKLKALGYFTERIGFPVLACVMMFYLGASSLAKMTDAIDRNAKAMNELTALNASFRQSVQTEHLRMMELLLRASKP